MKATFRSLLLQAAGLLWAVWGLVACSTPARITYFQDLRPGESEQQVVAATEIKVRPGDKLSIIVNSRDPQLTQLFNLPYVGQQIGQGSVTSNATSGNSQGVSGYTVDEQGMIDFPVLGKIEIAGKNREEIAAFIKEELLAKNLVKDPVVTVEYMNLCISVLGVHDMGPRQWEGTIQYGLEQGHKFGIMASTDQHSGYPGSYGDGRIGVLAPSLTRDAIWEAMRTRHVCAATGDKISIDFRLNDAFMGDVVRGNSRRIYLNITGESCIDYVDIVKNGQILARMNGPLTPVAPEGDTIRCKVKVDFGWNREEKYVHWQGKLSVNKGRIVSVTPCFRGAAFTSPQEGEHEFKTHVNRILSASEKETELDLYSSKNPNTTTPAMQAVILDLEMPKDGILTADFNGKKFEHSLGELLEGSRSHFMIGWLSEAILFNRAMPESCFTVEHYMEDKEPQRDTDYYYVRVRQRDGQWAWSSPIWAERV